MSHEKWVEYFIEGKNCCQLPSFFFFFFFFFLLHMTGMLNFHPNGQ